MTTFNVFVKTIGIIFFLIFLELIYKLTIYNRGSFFITNGIEGQFVLARAGIAYNKVFKRKN
jgi:hypothetical protein